VIINDKIKIFTLEIELCMFKLSVIACFISQLLTNETIFLCLDVCINSLVIYIETYVSFDRFGENGRMSHIGSQYSLMFIDNSRLHFHVRHLI